MLIEELFGIFVFLWLLAYIPLMIELYRLSVRYGRSEQAIGWVICSLLFSPILMIIVVRCIGETEETRKERLVADELLKIRIRDEVSE